MEVSLKKKIELVLVCDFIKYLITNYNYTPEQATKLMDEFIHGRPKEV